MNNILNKTNGEENPIWENTKYFKHLKENKEKVTKKLERLGIKRIIAFDELGEKWEEWENKKELTLAILPICNIIDQNGTETKAHIENITKYHEDMLPIDITTSEIKTENRTIVYFKTRNLLIAKINPFYNERTFEMIANGIFLAQPKYKTEKEIWKTKLEEQFMQMFETQEIEIKNRIETTNKLIEEEKRRYLNNIGRLTELKREEKNIKENEIDINKRIEEEIKKLKELPVIKEVKIRDRIYMNFGKIYINGKVMTGRKIENGIEVPKMEQKKVEIGELEFEIGGGTIRLKNKTTKERRLIHPHANHERICFGEAELEAHKLLKKLKIADLAKLLYSWANSYNDDDTYTTLQDFYENEKERNKKVEIKCQN